MSGRSSDLNNFPESQDKKLHSQIFLLLRKPHQLYVYSSLEHMGVILIFSGNFTQTPALEICLSPSLLGF